MLLVVLCVFVGCTPAPKPPSKDAVAGWSYVMVGVATLDNHDAGPTPDAPGTCPNCNGTGKVGDGRVFVDCKTCGGDGRIDGNEAKPSPVATEPKKVTTTASGSTIVCRPNGCTIQTTPTYNYARPIRRGLFRR